MKANTNRLLKLAAFLDKLPRAKFQFGVVIAKIDKQNCGTVCCAIGWTPKVFPTLVKWDDVGLMVERYEELGVRLFALSKRDANYLFTPGSYGNGLEDEATPKAVAKHIRDFVKSKLETQTK